MTHRISRIVGLVSFSFLLGIAPSRAQGVAGARQVCDNGLAAGYACSNVDLISQMERFQLTTDPVQLDPFGNPNPPSFRLNDIWGWKHEASGRSFLLVGRTDGTAFVEVTDPYNPVLRGDLLSTGNRNSSWRDVKVYRDHAYIVADAAAGHGVQVFDLNRLLSVGNTPVRFEADNVYTEVGSVHNIVINETAGFAFAVGTSSGGTTCGGGFHMIDLSDPGSPAFAGCYTQSGTSRNGRGYTHDAHCVTYTGPDEDHQGREICIGSNERSILIGDVTDKANPTTISIGQYPGTAYTHQGWLSEDHRYYFQGDELDELQNTVSSTRTLVWDLEDLDDPLMIAEYLGPRKTIDHNMYVRGNLLFQSQYVDGLRVVDVSQPGALTEVGFFDTHPGDLSVWDGSWSNYPFLDDNMVAVNSSVDGLFVVQPASNLITGVERSEALPEQVSLLTMYPNPFQDVGQLEVSVNTSGPVRIELIDLLGRTVQTAFDGSLQAGQVHRQAISGGDLAPGVYLVRVSGSGFAATHRVLKTR
jgi:choice-of-anchor B domain-containing protein